MNTCEKCGKQVVSLVESVSGVNVCESCAVEEQNIQNLKNIITAAIVNTMIGGNSND